jgi:hypothetical protein
MEVDHEVGGGGGIDLPLTQDGSTGASREHSPAQE